MTLEQFKTLTQPAAKPVAPNVAKALNPVLKQAPLKYETRTQEAQIAAPAAEAPKDIRTEEPVQANPMVQTGGPSRDLHTEAVLPEPEQTDLPIPAAEPYRIVGEVLDTYIIIEQGDAVLFLDKHAAHERILFEKLKQDPAAIMAQVLLVPISANLTREEAGVLLDNRELLRDYGYELEDFGGGTVLVRQIPADLDLSQAESALEALAADLLEGRAKDPADLRDDLLHTIACKAAIKAGWHTEPAERASLAKQVMENEDIKYCPHGRPVITTLTKKQLEKQFKR